MSVRYSRGNRSSIHKAINGVFHLQEGSLITAVFTSRESSKMIHSNGASVEDMVSVQKNSKIPQKEIQLFHSKTL